MTAGSLKLKPGWKELETQAVFFLLKLLFLVTIIKFLFYLNNRQLLKNSDSSSIWNTIGWSFFNDVLVIALINIPFLFLLAALSFRKNRIVISLINFLFMLANFFCLLLNGIDIFYFHFHGQRANADLLYVLKDPIEKGLLQNTFYTILTLLASMVIFFTVFTIHRKLLRSYYSYYTPFSFSFTVIAGGVFLLLLPSKIFVPTYPLVNIKSNELQLAQNSLHSFTYSVYRSKEGMVKPFSWMSDEEANRYVEPLKSLTSNHKKNIVLFIMESVPEEFFNTASKYKVKMPFVDSLLTHSTYYANAYSYAHHSNKAIVALLAGIPTLIEIPLYHSSYANISKTNLGDELAKQGYHSLFAIGDSYDDFGFAKCTNWMGIQNYYCKEDVEGYKKLPRHTMGLHDEYMLDFFGKKINQSSSPFLAVHYNISTHVPHDLPAGYKVAYPQQNFTAGMKSMNYYSECLRKFFDYAASQPWYNETVFVFCSDHWMYPDEIDIPVDVLQGFRIPIFIFDPLKNKQETINQNVSQLDIMNTILYLAGVKEPFISYGENLLNTLNKNRIVFMRENNTLYQAADSQYVLGFNPINGKTEFIFNKSDSARSNNLVKTHTRETSLLLKSLMAFLQKASRHYVQKRG